MERKTICRILEKVKNQMQILNYGVFEKIEFNFFSFLVLIDGIKTKSHKRIFVLIKNNLFCETVGNQCEAF